MKEPFKWGILKEFYYGGILYLEEFYYRNFKARNIVSQWLLLHNGSAFIFAYLILVSINYFKDNISIKFAVVLLLLAIMKMQFFAILFEIFIFLSLFDKIFISVRWFLYQANGIINFGSVLAFSSHYLLFHWICRNISYHCFALCRVWHELRK